ncbi:MAG: beta-phosphoglucomutase family hydrolase [Gordonia sp. (in: high G+C Gram-positive bacteria)]|uniref:HAD family hydrolase n=1 Tax=Gordonia sp. (in: high G+C Gram-positive bacteria) TaxID=84139 RepID=UPI0039E59652
MLGLPEEVSVALFDLDGVLTTTATLHTTAWGETFDAFLAERAKQDAVAGEDLRPFTEQDYLDHVDGRPRDDGVRGFLASRGITVDDATVDRLAQDKNDRFTAALQRNGVTPYPDAVDYLTAARDAGLRIAVVTSSKNGAAVLAAAGLDGFPEQRVDGNTIVAEGLRGKPAPDGFLRGAELMGVPAANAAVFEDAISGVQAGAAGHFGAVIGIDRTGGRQTEAMTQAGATRVVADLNELLAEGQ